MKAEDLLKKGEAANQADREQRVKAKLLLENMQKVLPIAPGSDEFCAAPQSDSSQVTQLLNEVKQAYKNDVKKQFWHWPSILFAAFLFVGMWVSSGFANEFTGLTTAEFAAVFHFGAVFLAVMFVYSPVMTGIVLGSFPFYVAISAVATPLFRRRLEEKFRRGAENQAFLVESVSGIETLKAMAMPSPIPPLPPVITATACSDAAAAASAPAR